jgi:hypothetical protein
LSLALLLGDPGAGKTEWLKQLVAQASRREAKRVRGFAVSNLDAVRLPVFVRLDSVGAHLPTPKQARKFLRQHGCITAQGYKPDNAELFAVGVIQALLAEKLMDARLAGEVWARLRPLVPGAAVPPPAQTRALLALDAWDEARKARDTLNAPLREYLERSPAQVFITSRLVDFEGEAFHVTTNDEAGPRRKLRVLPFTLTETEQFARDFFARDADGPRLAREFGDELRRKPTVAATAETLGLTRATGGGV